MAAGFTRQMLLLAAIATVLRDAVVLAGGGTLRLPLAWGDAPAPNFLHERHARRRRLQERTVQGPGDGAAVRSSLQGSLQLGYFSAVIGFGTPAQSFELIVDTGSHMTAVPCAGCTQCGRHRKFDSKRSSSAAVCTGDSSCAFSIAYQEGSAYRGTYVDRRLSRLGQRVRGRPLHLWLLER
ncbi:aspartic peptidase domain-containing protein [Pavlovales sp. CCMP2436]|nr:aspartic peptidase domain-containing protein [Pavlovales sp. CCMP2436]